ncbi:MAG: DNA replication and repair protein RecF [Ignavibacteriae bacterium]|nr:DNA replication and repair protein RecF [Ignavibacteriota bacterium]
MYINNILINNLRNHNHTEVDFGKGLNVLYGLNGSGKTTILEAISLCSFSKSFLHVSDSSLINKDENFWNVSTSSRSDLDVPYKVNIKLNGNSRKLISSTHGDNLLPKEIIGELPVVILSPDYKTITSGSPADRREFIDKILAQSSKVYIEDIIRYKKALKQRNNLLLKAKSERNFNKHILEPWTEILIDTGASIIKKRKEFESDFLPGFQNIYRDVSNGKEIVSFNYMPSGAGKIENSTSKEEIKNALKEKFASSENEELRRGTTLYGPQKDELKITINDGIAREFASQGQHKSLLISMKFSEFFYLKEKKRETPVVLLDDIFSELDIERAEKVLELVTNNSAQSLITVTDGETMKKIMPKNAVCNYYKIENGNVLKNNL